MKILIAGATGYLGRHLLMEFESKYDVLGLVRNKKNIKNNTQCFNSIDELVNVVTCFKPDVVINTVANYGRSGESFDSIVESNIYFPSVLAGLADNVRAKVFINSGTSLPEKTSFYASTKHMFVNLLKAGNFRNVKICNIELEHFYGVNDAESKFTTYIINSCLKGDTINMTSGEQERDFIYIDDVVKAYETIMKNQEKLKKFESISLGSGKTITLKDFVGKVLNLSGSQSEINFGAVPLRENEPMYSCSNNNRLNGWNWFPQWSLERGLIHTIQQEKQLMNNG